MCQFLSGYETNNRGIRYHKWIDSHTDQIEYFGDKDLDKKGDLLKFEITPPKNFDDFWDANKWNFCIDQDIVPSWGNPIWLESEARKIVQKMLDECPDCTDGLPLLDGRIIAIKEQGVVNKLTPSTYIRYAGYATIKYAGSATIKNAGHATIEDAGSATIGDAGYATIKNAKFATIKKRNK